MKKFLTLSMLLSMLLASAPGTIAGETAYGYLFGSKDDKHGFVSFDMDRPQTLTLINSNYGYVHPSAGEYVDGKIYTYQVELGDISEIYSHSWAVYDGTTFKQIEKKSMTSMNRAVDMTFDYTTNTLYALIEDKYSTGVVTPTSLYAIDMATGEYTLIGTPGELKAIDGYNREDTDGLITLACDAGGQLYAMSYYRYLYKVDKHTAKVTQVGERHNLGTAAQFQSMAFDAQGHLWWAQQHPSYGHFCEVDLETAIPGGFVDFRTDYEKLNKLGDDAQVTVLFMKDKTIRTQSLKAVTALKSAVDGTNVNTVVLTWVKPSETYAGDAADPQGYKVYRMGTSEAIATLDGSATSYTDTNAPNGDVVYEVVPFNAAGDGFPAFTTIFAGYDQLNAVSDIVLNVDGRDVTLTWKAPESTVNGGYADYNAITYNVYRSSATETKQVAAGLTATEFTETISEDGGFTYIIEPVCGGVTGKRAESEKVVLSSAASLPYFTGFEDDGDGGMWTIVNNPQSAGWTIGKKSYLYDGAKTAIGSTNGKPADDWLISPPIHFEAGQHIIDYYANGASYDTHSYQMSLGTDPASLDSFDEPFYAVKDVKVYDADGANALGTETKGWQHIETKFNVAEPGTYHLGIHNVNTCTYANLRIDNLSIKADHTDALETAVSDAPVTICTAEGSVTVSSTVNIASASIVNLTGCMVKSATGAGNTVVFDTTGMASGVYVVYVTTADGRVVSFKTIL